MENELFLYKIEVVFLDKSKATVVLMHDSEEKAFKSAENQLELNYLPPKKVSEMALVEKKLLGKGRGYVIEQ